MRERVQCEFFLIRYVPDVVKGEFVNIGVLLREAGEAASEAGASDRAVVRFTRDWSRVRCMDADADIGLLGALEGEIGSRLQMRAQDAPGIKPVMEILQREAKSRTPEFFSTHPNPEHRIQRIKDAKQIDAVGA